MTKKKFIIFIFLSICLTTVSSSACANINYGSSINLSNKQDLSSKEKLIKEDLSSKEDLLDKEDLSIKEKYKQSSDYYIDRVTTFRRLPNDKRDIIFLGDSLIDICEWSELFGNPLIKNRGISGDTTTGILDRLDAVVKGNPKKVFIMIGINDIGKGKTIEDIVNNYEKILQNIKNGSPNTEIYVNSVLPINKDLFITTTKDEEIINLNKGLKKLCEKNNVQYIDLYSLLVQSDNKLKSEYTTGGIHLNGKGYLVWKEAVKKFL